MSSEWSLSGALKAGALEVYRHPSGFSECSDFNWRLLWDAAECSFPRYTLGWRARARMMTTSWAPDGSALDEVWRPTRLFHALQHPEEDVTEAGQPLAGQHLVLIAWLTGFPWGWAEIKDEWRRLRGGGEGKTITLAMLCSSEWHSDGPLWLYIRFKSIVDFVEQNKNRDVFAFVLHQTSLKKKRGNRRWFGNVQI